MFLAIEWEWSAVKCVPGPGVELAVSAADCGGVGQLVHLQLQLLPPPVQGTGSVIGKFIFGKSLPTMRDIFPQID